MRFMKTYNKMVLKFLYDDRNKGAGEKLGDADLIGITNRLTIGTRGIESGEFDFYNRLTDKTEKIPESQIMNMDFLKKTTNKK